MKNSEDIRKIKEDKLLEEYNKALKFWLYSPEKDLKMAKENLDKRRHEWFNFLKIKL